ncbi:MAG: hypothetical protein JWO51_2496 [Rhodospirillales bacterium]|nr:hypothetical protein [Rhodospirillales bacterium]
MIDSVPALAKLSTAHSSAWAGASPGCQPAAAACSGSFVSACGVSTDGSAAYSLGVTASTPTASMAVDADAAGQAADDRDGVLLGEIHDLGALPPRHLQAIGNIVYAEDAAGAAQLGAGDGELPDRAAAEDGDRIAGSDFGKLRRETAGWKDVRDQDRFLVRNLVRQPDQTDMGEGDACLFRLQPMEGAARFRTAEERGPRGDAVRIGIVALGMIAGPAIGTGATGDRRWDEHPVADREIAYILAQLLDDPDAPGPPSYSWYGRRLGYFDALFGRLAGGVVELTVKNGFL